MIMALHAIPGITRLSADQIGSLILEEHPGLSAIDFDRPFDELPIDSFSMLTLRARIEQALGRPIADAVWTTINTPADLVRIVSHGADAPSADAGTAPRERRTYVLNMPQMAISGLSEAWLFKEMGDIHWHLITRNLGTSSSQLRDGEGHRLYATFTRIR